MLLGGGGGRALAYPAPIPLDALLDTRSPHDLTANDTMMSAAAPPASSSSIAISMNDDTRPHSTYEQALKRLHVTRQETSIEIELTTPSVRAPEPATPNEEEERDTAPIIPPDVLAETVAKAEEPAPPPEREPVVAKFDSEAPTEPEVAVAPELVPEPKPVRTSARDRKRATMGIPVSGPNDYWRTWAIALSSARGPQTLATFERLFAESYVPLANAIADGLDDARALRAYDEFRRAFEHTYTEAFTTFGVTNRRPKLVMDAYDLASKQSRLHNARSAHVLVVDSMRYDLGGLVRDQLARTVTGLASLTAETVLWSALPTTTLRQLETFARGMDALRAPSPIEATESLRGRSAEVVRRLRVGSRELYKLDIIPAMLEGCPRETAGLMATHEHIAEAVATSLFHHLRTLAPRTLLFIVGDHGFTIDRRGEILHGGASPEEVLVPAQAWLVGDLH